MRKGFTLVEVLIVLIVIGILATLMLPQMGTMAEKARLAEAKMTLGSLKTSLAMYYLENGNKFPATQSNAAGLNSVLGNMIGDQGRRLYEYKFTQTSITEGVLRAERNTNSGGGNPHNGCKMTIYGDGTASDMTVNQQISSAAIALGGSPSDF